MVLVMEKCKHERDKDWCCECKYGKPSKTYKRERETTEDVYEYITKGKWRVDYSGQINP